MGKLTREQRATYATRAAELYEDSEVEWVKGAWIKDIDSGVKIASADNSIGVIREFLNKTGLFRRRNKRCGVCAEGALLLSFVEDPNIPDDWRADDLLSEFREEAAQAAIDFAWYEDVTEVSQVPGIPSMNDDLFQSDQEAIRLLRRMSDV